MRTTSSKLPAGWHQSTTGSSPQEESDPLSSFFPLIFPSPFPFRLQSRANPALVGVCDSDDITYGSLAKAFDLPLEHHDETLKRMWAMGKARFDLEKQTPEQRAARERMGLLPAGKTSEVIFVEQDKWVVSHTSTLLSLWSSLRRRTDLESSSVASRSSACKVASASSPGSHPSLPASSSPSRRISPSRPTRRSPTGTWFTPRWPRATLRRSSGSSQSRSERRELESGPVSLNPPLAFLLAPREKADTFNLIAS